MRFATFFLLSWVLGLQVVQAAEKLVKLDTVSVAGASFVERSTDTISNIYGGVAGTCATKDSSSTCNSCLEEGSLQACNQTSIHQDLNFSVSFKPTKDITGKAKLYFLNASGNSVGVPVELASQAYSTTVGPTLTAKWSSICSAAGLNNCGSVAGPTTGVYVGKIAIGIDSDGNQDVDIEDETESIPVKIHFIAPSDPTVTSVNYCATTATPGFCKIVFEPGDEKVFIKEEPESDQPVTGGAESFGGEVIEFDAIAIFPVPVASEAVGGAAITGFITGNAAKTIPPIFVSIDPADNTNIESAEVSGGLQNYQPYCFIYGNRNKAGNIYRFVAGANATDAATIATHICKTPSEVVGLLEDKHCFISTAAFGSNMAKEVQTFREFRNQYLLTNSLGKFFVKAYYDVSPPIADVIAKYDTLRAATRAALYPFLVFSSIALKYGFAAALLTLISLLILIFKIKSVVKQKRLLLFLVVLMLTPALKAQVVPKTEVIQYPEAAQEGLVKITKDGTYIYDIKREMKSESSRISFGHALHPDVTIDIEQRDPATGQGLGNYQTFSFGDLYEETSSIIIGYDYEKFPWIGRQGKLGYQLGGAIMFAQGHGVLVSNLQPSREKYTFFTIPLMAGVVYRLEWKDKQLFAPYVAGGGTYTILIEKREDKSSPQYTGAPGFYAAGGGLLNVSVLDDEAGFALDSEYGISNLWLSLEFKVIEVNSDAFTFSNQYVNLGVSFDF